MGNNYIYLARFFSYFTQAVFFPYFAVWLFEEKLFSVAQGAIIVSLGIFAIRLGSLLFTRLVSRYQKKWVLIFNLSGLSIVYIVVWLLAHYGINSFLIWTLISILAGIFISVTSLAILSAIALQIKAEDHTWGFSYLSIALNLSAGIGPFIGAFVLYYYRDYLPLAPLVFTLISIFISFKFPQDPARQEQTSATKFSFGGKPFLVFMLINFLTFIGYAQFYDVFPLFAKDTLDQRIIGTLFLISGMVVVIFQAPITKLFKNSSHRQAIVIANLLVAIGTFLYLAAQEAFVSICILAVFITTIAELIYGPRYQTLAIKLFNSPNPVQALALQSFTWGLAESVATFVGLYLVGHGLGAYSYLIGITAAILVILAYKKLPQG